MCGTNEDVQYNQAHRSSVQIRMYSTNKKRRHQQKLHLNESLLLLIYHLKAISILWQATKIDHLRNVQRETLVEKSQAQMKEREKCKKNEPSLT